MVTESHGSVLGIRIDSRVAVCREEARGFLFFRGLRVANYMRDEGRPLEAGLQEQASNHLKLLW